MGRGRSGVGDGNSLTGGVNTANIKNERDLVSEREGKQQEVDSVLNVAKSIAEEYGVDVGQFILADVVGKDSRTMAYSDGENIGFNSKYFDEASMAAAYDQCVASGFHPSRGNKTGIEAVAAHEYAHVLTEQAARILGRSTLTSVGMGNAADTIVKNAMKSMGVTSVKSFQRNVSGYATYNNAETVAEAFADVYCNGSKASKESQAIVNEMNKILKSK